MFYFSVIKVLYWKISSVLELTVDFLCSPGHNVFFQMTKKQRGFLKIFFFNFLAYQKELVEIILKRYHQMLLMDNVKENIIQLFSIDGEEKYPSCEPTIVGQTWGPSERRHLWRKSHWCEWDLEHLPNVFMAANYVGTYDKIKILTNPHRLQ